jgi:hypothetical protein
MYKISSFYLLGVVTITIRKLEERAISGKHFTPQGKFNG